MARRDGDHYILNGSKQWITNGSHANVFLVYARTGQTRRDISAFIVEADRPGFSVGRKERKMDAAPPPPRPSPLKMSAFPPPICSAKKAARSPA